MDIHDEKELVFDIENKKISLAPKLYSAFGACAVVGVNAVFLDGPFLLLKYKPSRSDRSVASTYS